MEAQTVIDRDTFDELRDLMGADFVRDIISTYNEETEALVGQLQTALAAQDAATFGRCAHSIKSSSASLGALAFAEQARELELMGKAGDLSGADPRVEQLAADFAVVRRSLEELRDEC